MKKRIGLTLLLLLLITVSSRVEVRGGALQQSTIPSSLGHDLFLPLIQADAAPVNDPNGGTVVIPPQDAPQAVAGQYVVVWKSSTRAGAAASNAPQPPNIDVLDVSELLTVDQGDAETILDSYRNNPDVESVEPNYLYHALDVPNDPNQNRQWAWAQTDAYAAWDVTRGSADVIIAVVDTGIQLNHPDLDDKLVPGYDFVDDDDTPSDGNGHGTHVAGTAAAETGNGTGGAGFCPECRLMPVRALDDRGSGSVSDIARAVIYAADNGADVINLSLGGTSASSTLRQAIDYAWNRGVFVTCAAGNSNTSSRHYPAGFDNCMAVASTTSSDERSSFSNYGDWVAIAAPGSSIYSTYPTGRYATLSGTSMAAPHVAGLAGLLASQGWSNAQIRDRLCSSADPVAGTGTFWTCGRINAAKAVAGSNPPEPTNIPTVAPTNTPSPTPTATKRPTNTPTPMPTSTPTAPAPTDTAPTPTPTATPTNTPPPSQPGALINGGFEEGESGWRFSAADILSTDRPFSGDYGAHLGGENNSSDAVEQTVVVPASGRLTYYWYTAGANDMADTMRLDITLVDYNARYSLSHTVYNGYWYRRTLWMGNLAGLTVRLKFSAETNGNSPTSFYLDDVSLE